MSEQERLVAIRQRWVAAAEGVYIEIGGDINAYGEVDRQTICYAQRGANGRPLTTWEHVDTLRFFLEAKADVGFLLEMIERLKGNGS